MKTKGGYHCIEVEKSDRVMIQKEGTMLYFRVLDELGVLPEFRLDIQCQSDEHALQIMEGIHGKDQA